MNIILYDLGALLDDKDINLDCYDVIYTSLAPLIIDSIGRPWNDDDKLYRTVYQSIQKMRRIMRNMEPDTAYDINLYLFVGIKLDSGFKVYDKMPGADLIKYIMSSDDVRSIIDMIDSESDKEEFIDIINKFNDDKMFSDICAAYVKERHH